MVTNRSKLNFKPETNILADYIIPTPERRFISDNLIDHLNKIKDSYMDKEDYTTDLNGTSIVKLSERSLSADSIEWDNILHKPTLDLKEVNEAIQALHTHNNLNALDCLSISNDNKPIWNNTEWPYPTTSKVTPLNELHTRNICIDEDPPKSSYDGDLWFQIDTSAKTLNSINIRKDNEWYTMNVNELLISIANRISKNFQSKQDCDYLASSSYEAMANLDLEGLVSIQLNKLLNERVFNEELVCDGVSFRYLITHSFGTRKVLAQIIDDTSGVELDKSKYSLVRNSDNTIILTFNVPPIKNQKYSILLAKVDY